MAKGPITKVVLASRNEHKLIELRRMLVGTGVELVGLDEAAPGSGELREEEETFLDNAIVKGIQALELCGLPALADDSGLEVDALDGKPGVHSARYSGVHGNSAANTKLLLENLRDVPDSERTSRFRCVIALVELSSSGEYDVTTFDGSCEGRIAHEPKGDGGFGYDPVFYLPDRGLTVAQLTDEEKDAISHRGRAVARLCEYLCKRNAVQTLKSSCKI